MSKKKKNDKETKAFLKARNRVKPGDSIVVYYYDGTDTGIALESFDQVKINKKQANVQYLSSNTEAVENTNGGIVERIVGYNAIEMGNIWIAEEKYADIVYT